MLKPCKKTQQKRFIGKRSFHPTCSFETTTNAHYVELQLLQLNTIQTHNALHTMNLRSRQIQTPLIRPSSSSDFLSKQQRKRPANIPPNGKPDAMEGGRNSKQSRMVLSCKEQNGESTLSGRITRSSSLKTQLAVDDSFPKEKSSISRINSGLSLLRKSSSSLFTLRSQQLSTTSTSSSLSAVAFDEDKSDDNHKQKRKDKSKPKTAWTEAKSSQLKDTKTKSSSRLLRTTSSSPSKNHLRESNILTKDQKKRVEKLLKKFSKKQQHNKSKKPFTVIINTSDEEVVHCRGNRGPNSSSIYDEEYHRPANGKQRTRSRQHVNMITSTLEDYGDGSTLTDLIDYSRITYETEHCTLLVLHALKEAVKTSQVVPYKDMFVREDCYEEFLEDEKQRDEEVKMAKKLMKKNSIAKITFKKAKKHHHKSL